MGQLNLAVSTRRDDATLKSSFETPGTSPKHETAQKLINFLQGLVTGSELGPSGSAPKIAISIEGLATAASGTITQTVTGAANGETLTIAGVTFTAKTSGASTNEWNRNNTVATSATNLAAAINASPNLAGIVTATSALGVVTIKSAVKGLIGNGLVAANVNCSNTTVVSFASGAADPTAKTLSF